MNSYTVHENLVRCRCYLARVTGWWYHLLHGSQAPYLAQPSYFINNDQRSLSIRMADHKPSNSIKSLVMACSGRQAAATLLASRRPQSMDSYFMTVMERHIRQILKQGSENTRKFWRTCMFILYCKNLAKCGDLFSIFGYRHL